MRKFFALLLMLPLFAIAQQGMKFEHGLSWKQIQEKAKNENKYIFMDAFTTWCGPCKYMSAKIFPMSEVGNFYNEKFINVKVQLDTTKADNDEVKSWYKDGHDIMTSYKVQVFPTYLFFSPDGKLVHRAVGAGDAAMIIGKGKDALDPGKQFYTLHARYKGGSKDPALLKALAKAAMDSYELEVMKNTVSELIQSGPKITSKDDYEFFSMAATSAKDDPAFTYMLNNTDKFDGALGKGVANEKLVNIIMESVVNPIVFKKGFNNKWENISASLQKDYPTQADQVLLSSKVFYYQQTKDWNNFQAHIVDYVNKYGSKLTPTRLNDLAWTVFENCSDMACINKALEWSKRSLAAGDEPMFMDTYANFLYRKGKAKEAKAKEKKALELAPANDKASYQETLDKMKKGEKTWNE